MNCVALPTSQLISNTSVVLTTSQLILNPSVDSPTPQLIIQPFFRFFYVTDSAHSPTFPSLHLRHSSFSNPSVTSPTSQLILQPFRCFTYVTARSPTIPLLHLRHRLFTYVTWQAAHAINRECALLYSYQK